MRPGAEEQGRNRGNPDRRAAMNPTRPTGRGLGRDVLLMATALAAQIGLMLIAAM